MRGREPARFGVCGRAVSDVFAVLAVALVTGARVAAAADPVPSSPAPVRGATQAGWLQWARAPGAESCLGAAEFAVRVEKQLGESPVAAARRSRRRISVRLERLDDAPMRWSADLALLGEDGAVAGTRPIHRGDESCGPLGEALVLAAVLILSGAPDVAAAPALAGPLIPAPRAPSPRAAPPAASTDDSNRSRATTAPPSAPASALLATPVSTVRALPPPPAAVPVVVAAASSGPSAPSVPLVSARAPVTSPAARARRPEGARGWQAALSAGPATGVGLLPSLAVAGEARLALSPPSWPTLLASAMVWRGERSALSSGAAGATLGLWSTGLAVCPVDIGGGSRAFVACAGAELGRLRASGFGFDRALDATSWALDLSVGAGVRQRFAGGFFAELEARALVPMLRNRISYLSANGASVDVYRMWPVAAVGGLAVGYNFR